MKLPKMLLQLMVPGLMILALASPAAGGADLLANGGFEAGDDVKGPDGWSWETSRPGAEWLLTASRMHGGKRALVIRSATPVDARFYQDVRVEPETTYRLSGWIAAQDVPADMIGAVLSLRGTFHCTDPIVAGQGWNFVELFFRTYKGQTSVSIAARLGMWGNEITGTAYFDDLRLEKVSRAADGFIQLSDPGVAVSGAAGAKPATSYWPWLIALVLLLAVGINLFFYYRQRRKKTEALRRERPRRARKLRGRGFDLAGARPGPSFAVLERRILGIRLATLVFFLILLLGAVVRLYGFGSVPPGINQDEASLGYDAFALANYGIERNGQSFPVHLVAWGSGQSALYVYIIMPFVKLFGLNSVTLRLGNLLLGFLGVVFLFLAGRRTAGVETGLLSAFLLAISPWGIISSRWGLEANILPWLMLIGLYLYIRSFDRRIWLIPSFAVFAIALYSYNTAYFVVPLFLLLLAVFRLVAGPDKRANLKSVVLGLLVFAAVAAPIAIFLLLNIIPGNRLDLRILGLTIPKLVAMGTRYQQTIFFAPGAGLAGFIQKIGANWGWFYDTVFRQEGVIWNVIPGYGNIYHVSIFFFLVGLVVSCARTIRSLGAGEIKLDSLMPAWFFLAAALGVLSEVNTNRMSVIFPPLIFLTAYGLFVSAVFLGRTLRKLIGRIAQACHLEKIAQGIAIGLYLVVYSNLFLSFTGFYFREYPERIGGYFQESFGEALRHVSERNRDERTVIISKFNMAYIYVLFYERYPPERFHSTVCYDDPNAEFRTVRSFSHYRFSVFEAPTPAQANAFYIVENDRVQYLPAEEARSIQRFKRFTVLQF